MYWCGSGCRCCLHCLSRLFPPFNVNVLFCRAPLDDPFSALSRTRNLCTRSLRLVLVRHSFGKSIGNLARLKCRSPTVSDLFARARRYLYNPYPSSCIFNGSTSLYRSPAYIDASLDFWCFDSLGNVCVRTCTVEPKPPLPSSHPMVPNPGHAKHHFARLSTARQKLPQKPLPRNTAESRTISIT